MFKFVFYLCISTLVFCECSGFWFDLLNYDNDKNTTESSSENCFDELVEWISKCFFGLDSNTEEPNFKPPIKNLTTPGQINSNLGSKNSSVNQEPVAASNASPDINSVKPIPPAVTQSASNSSATNKDQNTEIQNPPALSQNSAKKDDNSEIQNPGALSQNSAKKDDNTEIPNPPELSQNSDKKEEITPSEETNTATT